MGLLDSIFGSDEDKIGSSWASVRSEEEINQVFMASNEQPQILLKHSTRCATSFFVKKNLDAIPLEKLEDASLHILDVIRDRTLALYVQEKTGIRHESPQLFVIKDGQVVWHDSHHMVNEDNLLQALG